MKTCFIHDTKFKRDADGNLYTDGSYSEKIWKRYEKFFDELTVLARLENRTLSREEAIQQYNEFDRRKKKFVELPNIYSIADFVKNYYKANKIIKKNIEESNMIISRLPSFYGNIACKYAKKKNKKYLIEVVGCTWDAFWNYSYIGKIISIYSFLKMRKTIREGKEIIYVSNDFLQRRYPTKGNTIACSDVELIKIDDDVINRRIKKIDDKEKNEKIIIGTLAAVDVKYKGQAEVIKSIAKLKRKGYEFEYQLVGGGKKDYLENLVNKLGLKDNVKFLGMIPHNEVFKWLDEIDLYIQPSRQEGLSRALIEALSRACPCIASNAGGNVELIDKKYIFKKGKHKMIAELLLKMDKEESKQQARINFEKAKQYKKEILDNRREKFYKEILNRC